MEIVWEVDDGYIGKSRPQIVEFDLDDLEDDMTIGEAMDVVYEVIEEEFRQNIMWSLMNEAGVRAAVEAHLAER